MLSRPNSSLCHWYNAAAHFSARSGLLYITLHEPITNCISVNDFDSLTTLSGVARREGRGGKEVLLLGTHIFLFWPHTHTHDKVAQWFSNNLPNCLCLTIKSEIRVSLTDEATVRGGGRMGRESQIARLRIRTQWHTTTLALCAWNCQSQSQFDCYI